MNPRTFKMASPVASRRDNEEKTVLRVCATCGKGFRSKSGLYSHEATHRDTSPYRCCGKLFFSRANLQRHRCSVHNAEPSYECDVCNKKYATEADVRKHMKFHQAPEFKCDVCGERFRTKTRLYGHKDTHTGNRRYGCTCGKRYRHESNLYRHRKACNN